MKIRHSLQFDDTHHFRSKISRETVWIRSVIHQSSRQKLVKKDPAEKKDSTAENGSFDRCQPRIRRSANEYKSIEPPVFLEISYKGGSDGEAPIALVGKGVTFDSGGISIKPSSDMGLMRGDMAGAATVISTLLGLGKLGVKKNVIGLVPLCENMPSGTATKPGEIEPLT